MLAALPMRKEDEPAVERTFHYEFRRSARMLARFTQEVRFSDSILETPRIPSRNRFFSRISDQGMISDFKRVELVNHVSHMMIYVGKERGSYIPWSWFNSIFNLVFYMKREMLVNKDFDEGDWLPYFPFQIPPYEPNTFKKWEESSDRWEDVRPPEDPGSPSKVLPIANLSLSG
ncbi:hypothetical protein F5B21DRAFT_487285 [Xylaria acuta]|nr:hypothetical protein F5B21DRAFT_487285 [Xylaria acuta]